jgi:hypothetical membrane protein
MFAAVRRFNPAAIKEGCVMKQVGLYLILGGIVIFLLAFIRSILTFLGQHPIMGLALLAIVAGVILLFVGVYRETEKDKKEE